MSEENNSNNSNNSNNTKREFILDGIIGEENIHKLVEEIIKINRYDAEQKEKDENYIVNPFKLIINTVGGSLYDANFAIGVIESSQTPIHTYCYGKAMSAGFYIFASGHMRFATSLATFMYHDGTVGIHNTIEGLENDLQHMVKLRDNYDMYILSRTKLPKYKMDETKKCKKEWYMFAREAKEYGLVDEIIEFR